jgi:hypothetical protein
MFGLQFNITERNAGYSTASTGKVALWTSYRKDAKKPNMDE